MATYYLLHGDWIEPQDQDELNTLLAPIRSWLKNVSIDFDVPDQSYNSIDWTLIRDYLIPDSNEFIDDSFRPIYGVPLRKTVNINPSTGKATKFNNRIVDIAAVYIAWRIETFQFPGAANPEQSTYGKFLEGTLNQFINDVVTFRTRLRGQRLKGKYRTVNPNFEPVEAKTTVRTVDSNPGIQPYTTDSSKY